MATLSMFFGIIIKMYKERDGRAPPSAYPCAAC